LWIGPGSSGGTRGGRLIRMAHPSPLRSLCPNPFSLDGRGAVSIRYLVSTLGTQFEAAKFLAAESAKGKEGVRPARPIAQTRPLLLAGAGGEPPDAAAVRCHAGEDCGVAVTGVLGSSLSEAKFRLFAGILGKITALPRPAG
jgi:hypothetical protein